MQNDSDIIHYATWSLNNDSPLQLKDKYHKEVEYPKKKHSTSNTVNSNKNTSFALKLKHELKTFCCFVCFITFKSFKFHSVIIYITLLSFMGLFTSMIQGGYLSAIMTNLQTHFNISTSKVGLILASFDIMAVFATPLVSYIGSRYNKCRIIGVCGIFYVIGCVIYTLPYFLADKYVIQGYNSPDLNKNKTDLFTDNIEFCKIKNTTSLLSIINNHTNQTNSTNVDSQASITCNRDFANMWPYYTFICGQLFMSIGSAPLFSLGVTYLCDNLEERLHAFYTGILYGSFALGPAIGYLIASLLLSKWVYLNESPPVTERDPRWVGCWFLGFLIAAFLILIVSILLLSFPEHLVEESKKKKDKKKLKKVRSMQSLIGSTITTSTDNDNSSKDLNNQKRVLHTIDEANEIVNQNFEFLDSVSSRVSNNLINTPVISLPSVNTYPLDSISTISTSNSSSTVFQSISSTPSLTCSTLPSLVPSDANSNALITSNIHEEKNTCSKKLIEKINDSKLKFKGFLSSFLKLILNLRYSLLVLIMSIECILVATFTNYMILYTQNVYQVASSRASILVGGVIVPSAIIGAVFGGFIVRRFDLYIEGCVRLIILSSTVVVGGIFVLLFIRCEGVPSTGIDMTKQSFNTSYVECNMNCNCQSTYSPTCGVDKVTYVSPCYAGCKLSDSNGYYDCTCVKPNEQNDLKNITVKATPGACSRECDTKLIIFLIVLFTVVAFESLSLTPATMLILKLIDKPLQPFALGVLRCANILIAYIPAPIVLAQVIDKTCILWNNQCVGDKGTCLEYSTFDFHFVLFGTSAGIKIASCIVLIVFSLYIHKSFILRRKYRNKATLNHDPSSILTPKQKYRIDSLVASSETSLTESEDAKDEQSLYNIKKSKVKKRSSTLNSAKSGVVLKRHLSFEDDFTSLGQSQSSDYFANIDRDRLNSEIKDKENSMKNTNRVSLHLNLNESSIDVKANRQLN